VRVSKQRKRARVERTCVEKGETAASRQARRRGRRRRSLAPRPRPALLCMRDAKRARTVGPAPSSSSHQMPSSSSTSPPSSDPVHPHLGPASSITALGQRLLAASRLDSSQTLADSSQPAQAGLAAAGGSSHPHQTPRPSTVKAQGGPALDEDDIMDDDCAAGPSTMGPKPEAPSPGPPLPLEAAVRNAEWAPPVVTKTPNLPSSPVPASQLSSSTQRRTKDEIAAQKEAALRRVRPASPLPPPRHGQS